MSKTSKAVPVAQYNGKTLMAKYPSIQHAADVTGTQRAHIGKVANGIRKSAGGFAWRSMKTFSGKFSPSTRGVTQTDKTGNVIAVYRDAATASNLTGISESVINAILTGTRKTAKGFSFTTAS